MKSPRNINHRIGRPETAGRGALPGKSIRGHARSRTGGFTLLELLIGVIAFAIVLAAINAVFYSGLRLRNRTAEAIEKSIPTQQALGILKRDLANLVPPGGVFGGELQTTPTTNSTSASLLMSSGEPVSPELFTASALIDETSPWTEIQKVRYFLVAPTNNATPGRDLMRYVTRNLLPVQEEQPVPHWLLSGVETVTFHYFDGSSWLDAWDSTSTETRLPVAIRVEIELATQDEDAFQQPPIELVVPLMVTGGTNTTEAAGGGI